MPLHRRKALAVYTVSRITKLDRTESVGRMTIMAHGGEFAFVLFSAATTAGVMTKDQNATLHRCGNYLDVVLTIDWLINA